MSGRIRSRPGPYLIELRLEREQIPDPEVYPYNLPALRGLSTLPFHPRVTFLVGENGTGKSTLIEGIAVACRLNPEGGSRNFNFATRPSHSPLHKCIRLAKTGALSRDMYFLRAESFYNVATEVDQVDVTDGYGGRSLHEQSHGESFFALFENRFREYGLYLLDEPEAALSPKRQLHFLNVMHGYIRRGGQFIIATHSPILMAYSDALIYSLDGDGIRPVAYADTDHYLVTRGFLSNPQRSLDLLLADET